MCKMKGNVTIEFKPGINDKDLELVANELKSMAADIVAAPKKYFWGSLKNREYVYQEFAQELVERADKLLDYYEYRKSLSDADVVWRVRLDEELLGLSLAPARLRNNKFKAVSFRKIKKINKAYVNVIVPYTREAVFIDDGKIDERAWESGKHRIKTKTMYDPFAHCERLTRRASKDLPSGQLKFRHSMDLFLINKTVVQDIKWGTEENFYMIDPILKMPVPFGAHGVAKFSISNSKLFMTRVVGTKGENNIDDMTKFFRSKIVMLFNSLLGKKLVEMNMSIFQLASQLHTMSGVLLTAMKKEFADYGVNLEDFAIEHIAVVNNKVEDENGELVEERINPVDLYANHQEILRIQMQNGENEALLKSLVSRNADANTDRIVRLIEAKGKALKDAKDERSIVINKNKSVL